MSQETPIPPPTLNQMTRIRAVLGERNPMTVLAATIDALEALTLGVASDLMRAHPFPDKWSPNEILGHLVDCELVFAFRIRMILSQENPPIMAFDQDLWVAAQHHNETLPADHLIRLRALRTMNLVLWRSIPEEAMRRTGQHSERGPESLERVREIMAGHDLIHLDQLERYLEENRRQQAL